MYSALCSSMLSNKDKFLDRIHCLSNPCSNGAECIEVPATSEKLEGTYKCGCKGGFMGDSCEGKNRIWFEDVHSLITFVCFYVFDIRIFTTTTLHTHTVQK